MSPERAPLFTANRIAQVLGRTRQHVYLELAKQRPDGEVLVRGQRVGGWKDTSLPDSLGLALDRMPRRSAFRTRGEMLAAGPGRYESSVPLPEIAPAAREKAKQLCHALRPFLLQRNGAETATEAFVRRGLEEYRRVFGYPISARTWRDRFERTIARDAGYEEWSREELYLEENPPRAKSALPISSARELSLDVLEDAFCVVLPQGTLTIERKDYLWTKVCDQLQIAVANGGNAKRTKRAILKVLLACGLLGSDKETLRRNLNQQWKTYCAAGGKIVDGRRNAGRRKLLPNDDREKLIARALDCGGRIRQGFRELRDAGDLTQETLDRTISNPSRKSYIPATIARELAPEVGRLMPLHRGNREFELAGPYVPQDETKIAAGQVMQLDDVTLPVVYWESDPEAPGGIFCGRGQWILAIDVRSRMALGHALHSAPVYNMRIVRSLLLHVHDAYGLPETLLLERGMWRTAKIIKGDELDITHTEQGLREFGVSFKHRTKPRGKIIERVIGLLQNKMERLPGYVGRNERDDRQERVQEQILAVNSGREHPSKHFLSKQEWLQVLDDLLVEYNREPQGGKLNAAPAEVWNASLTKQGTVQLGAQARYLLAHHRKLVKVQRSGIRLPASLGGGLYYGAATGRFAGERMLAWINPESLEQIVLTSEDRREGPFVVERADALSPIGATDAELQHAHEQIAAHNEHARTQYRIVQPHLVRRNFRRLWHVDPDTIDLGERIAVSTAEAGQARGQQKRALRSANRLAREGGLQVRIDHRNASRVTAAAELAREAFAEAETEEKGR